VGFPEDDYVTSIKVLLADPNRITSQKRGQYAPVDYFRVCAGTRFAQHSILYTILSMFGWRECNECQNILAELHAALSEIRASPKLTKQLCDDARLLLGIGTGDGADEAIGQFPFHTPRTSPKYPKIAAAFRRMSQHKLQAGHSLLFSA
jgi:hypothetical protein